MFIDVTSLTSAPGKKLQGSVVLDLKKLMEQQHQLILLEPVQVDYSASSKANKITIRGKIKTRVAFNCCRCLEKVALAQEATFSEQFIHETQVEQAESDRLMDDLHIFSGNEINLAEIVEQNIIINLPLKVVCAEDCQGLCPECGANLNVAECNCVADELDPRLAVLQKLLDPSNSPKEVDK